MIELAGGPEALECACDGLVARCLTLLRLDQNGARDPGSVLTVEDAPASVCGSGREANAEGRPERTLAPQTRSSHEGVQRGLANLLAWAFEKSTKKMWWNDAVETAAGPVHMTPRAN